jgi:hypothetical protein
MPAKRLARPLVVAIGIVVVLLGGSLVVGGGKRGVVAGQTKITRTLEGTDADRFIEQWAATHPSYRRMAEESAAFWGATPQVGKSKVIQLSVKVQPSLARRVIGYLFPKLQAETYQDDSGTIITTSVPSPSNVWDGFFYAYFNPWQDDIGANAEVDASQDYVGDANWVDRDQGGYSDRHRVMCERPFGWLARLTGAIWPKAEAACACMSVCQGTLTNCALRNALTRARVQCGVAAGACRLSGQTYLDCLGIAGGVCVAAVYVDFFDELWQYGSSCGWTNPCHGI